LAVPVPVPVVIAVFIVIVVVVVVLSGSPGSPTKGERSAGQTAAEPSEEAAAGGAGGERAGERVELMSVHKRLPTRRRRAVEEIAEPSQGDARAVPISAYPVSTAGEVVTADPAAGTDCVASWT